MDFLVEFFNRQDLTGSLNQALAAVDTTDPRFLAVPVLLLVFLGAKMVANQPGFRAWGLRLGVAVFLAHAAWAWYVGTPAERNLFDIGLRSANLGGSFMGLCWIILPVLAFLWAHLRLAMAAFLGYSSWALFSAGTWHVDQLPAIAGQALVAVALVLVIAWIVHPVWDFFRDLLPRPAVKPEEVPANLPLAAAQSSPGMRCSRRRRRHSILAAVATAGPAIDRREIEQFVREQLETQRRRDRARVRVEVLYALIQPEVESRMPRLLFDDMLQRHLNDQLPADAVEQNSRQIESFLLQQRMARPLSMPLPDLFVADAAATRRTPETEADLKLQTSTVIDHQAD